MTTAFVLSGGGSLGAVQVGMLQALGRSGVHPDLLVGTSAGAMNAAWVAGHGLSWGSLTQLAEVWSGLRRHDIFSVNVHQAMRGLLGMSPAVGSNHRLATLVAARAGIRDLAEAAVPVHMVATDVLTGQGALISTGPVLDAVLASSAIPGLFPPVRREGRHLVDGGVSGHAGVAEAVDLGATEIYVLPTGAPCALQRPPRSAVGVALHALTLLMQQRLSAEIAACRGAATIKVLPPLCPLAISAADFGHARELVDRGLRSSADWLEGGAIDLPQPERFLAPHRHRRTPEKSGASERCPA